MARAKNSLKSRWGGSKFLGLSIQLPLALFPGQSSVSIETYLLKSQRDEKISNHGKKQGIGKSSLSNWSLKTLSGSQLHYL